MCGAFESGYIPDTSEECLQKQMAGRGQLNWHRVLKWAGDEKQSTLPGRSVV